MFGVWDDEINLILSHESDCLWPDLMLFPEINGRLGSGSGHVSRADEIIRRLQPFFLDRCVHRKYSTEIKRLIRVNRDMA